MMQESLHLCISYIFG